MWKRMLDFDIWIGVAGSLLITWPICWLLVYKAGWRYTDWLGLATEPFPDNMSFVAYLMLSNIAIGCVVAPLLALARITRRAEAAVARARG